MEIYISLQNEVVDIFSLLSRDIDLLPFMAKYQSCLLSLKTHIAAEKNQTMQESYFFILTILYKLIAYTRDIHGGLGERKLSYMMLFLWNYQFPLPAAHCLKNMVMPIQKYPPYGSWRDIKGMCLFIREFSEKGENDPFIETCLGLMNHQLDVDYTLWNNTMDEYERKKNAGFATEKPTPQSAGISMVAKWIPRECSSFGWLFKRATIQWIRSFKPHYFKSCKSESQFESALKKGSKEYRQVFSSLSKELDVLEIKQCKKEWKSIEPANIPFSALLRQNRSLLNISSNGGVRKTTASIHDRVSCAVKIQQHWRATRSTNTLGKTLTSHHTAFIDMGGFIQNALRVLHPEEVMRMETQWRHILSQSRVFPFSHVLPIVDLSLFRDQENRFYEAIGLACIIAMKSSKRILFFDQTTHFVSIEHCTSLKDILHLIRPIYYEHHIGQNFKAVCDTLLLSICETKLHEEHVKNMKLVFFTYYDRIDMIQEIVQEAFENAGFVHSPFLLVWRAAKKIPIHSSFIQNKPRTFVFSGNSNYTLYLFSLMGCDEWNDMNAFDLIAKLLDTRRYDIFENYFRQVFQQDSDVQKLERKLLNL